MKKAKKISLIAAAVLILAGCAVSGTAYALSGFDITKFNSIQYSEKEYEFTEDFENIHIEAVECDVQLVTSSDGKYHVTVYDSEEIYHKVSAENGTLEIIRYDDRKWWESMDIDFFSEEMVITVALPKNEFDKLYAESVSGDVKIGQEFSFDSAEIVTTSGDVDFSGEAETEIEVSTVSGDITISGVETDKAFIETTSGEVKLKSVIADKAEITSVSGDITFDGCYGKEFDIDTTSGDITFDSCDGEEFDVDTTSGDVKGTLLSGKDFVTDTVSGDIDLPKAEENGTFNVVTVSGDIKLKTAD